MGYVERGDALLVKCDICGLKDVISESEKYKLRNDGWIWGMAQNYHRTNGTTPIVKNRVNFGACPEHKDVRLEELEDEYEHVKMEKFDRD